MIDINKKYRTRDGRNVRILCVDREHTTYPIVGLINNDVTVWTNEGKLSAVVSECSFDLIEVSPYDHIKKGDVVLVWNKGWETKYIRVFHSVEGRFIRVFYELSGLDEVNTYTYENCELYQLKEQP